MPGFGVEVAGVSGLSCLSGFRGVDEVDGVETAGSTQGFSLVFSFSLFTVPFSLERSGRRSGCLVFGVETEEVAMPTLSDGVDEEGEAVWRLVGNPLACTLGDRLLGPAA